MFKIVPQLTAWWPVTVLEPDNDNPGTLKEFTFEAEFVIRGRDEMKPYHQEKNGLMRQLPTGDDILKDRAAAEAKADKVAAKLEAHDLKMFHLMVKNWRGVFDEKDNPLPFTAETFNLALNQERIRAGLNKAYDEATSNDKARVGNSNA